MSEDKRHLDEGWDDLPLPDANAAWQKMEVLLDEDKKRRRVLPFWFWRNAGLGLLLVGIMAGGWFWLFGGEATTESTSRVEKTNPVTTKEEKQTSIDLESNGSQPKQQTKETTIGEEKENSNTVTSSDLPREEKEEKVTTTAVPGKDKAGRMSLPIKKQVTKKEKRGRIKKKTTPPDLQLLEEVLIEEKEEQKNTAVQPQKPAAKDTISPITTVAKDSTTKKDTAIKKTAEPMVANEDKTDSSQEKKSAFLFSAGIGLQQAIAINGQQSTSYNYNGKKGSLSDRIPSVYFRIQKGKWFAQTEFQYSVPQPVKPFSFSQKTTFDVSSLNLNKEQFSIQKLYYHQLPVSINYFVLPNWSIGAGGMYNVLAGAVTEQEINRENVLTGDVAASRNVAPVKGYKDSFLYKTTAGIIYQTDYHWKRFALGLRFTQNLQPFIKYTKPDGQIVDERNKVLQAILRFRLF